MQALASITSNAGSRRSPVELFCFCLIVTYISLTVVAFSQGVWMLNGQGRAIATDFMAFWAAGRLVLQGHAVDAYDIVIHKSVITTEIGAGVVGNYTFQYPPTILLVTPLIALLPYPAAFLSWAAVGISAYAASIRLIVNTRAAVMAALAWPAVMWNMMVVQNGLITAALLGGGLALIEKRPALAGILFGMLTFKPQVGLLIPIALVAGGYWRVIAWAAASTLCLAAASSLLLGMDTWGAFLASAAGAGETILLNGKTGFFKVQSLYGYMRLMGLDNGPALAIHCAFAVVLAAGVALLWGRPGSMDVKCATLAAATVMASPYAFIYDLVPLAVALAFLGRAGFSSREIIVVFAAGALLAWGPSMYLHMPTGQTAAFLVLGLAVNRALAELRSSGATLRP